jgi:PhnB protein
VYLTGIIQNGTMEIKNISKEPITSSIEPWLTVSNGAAAVDFYKAAFGAIETYRMEAPDGGLVVKFTIDGAGFWISSDADSGNATGAADSRPIRMILTVTDPDASFAKALKAGAAEIFPVGEGYGWRLGRLADPFGHHWEIGRPLDA